MILNRHSANLLIYLLQILPPTPLVSFTRSVKIKCKKINIFVTFQANNDPFLKSYPDHHYGGDEGALLTTS